MPTSGDVCEIVTASNVEDQFAAVIPPKGVGVMLTYEAMRVVAAVRYGLPEVGTVRLTVYDALGRRVAILVDGVWPQGGTRSRSTPPVCRAAAHLYQLDTVRFREVRRMLLMK